MSTARQILVALAAGVVVGMAAASVPALAPLPRLVEPVGQLWLRALQMTIVPLVVSLIVTGICTAAPSGGLARQGGRVAALFVTLLLGAGVLGTLVVQSLLLAIPVPAALQSAQEANLPTPTTTFAGGAWLDAILPLNPARAAADGAMLPLVVFTLLFALALSRVATEAREPVVRFFRGVSEAMLVLVGWVLRLTPLGVFAIVIAMIASVGGGSAWVVAYYGILLTALALLVTALLYPLGARGAGVSVAAFARALLPAQTIAAATRSSVATLPAMLDAARALRTPRSTASFVLPLAVTLFRITTPPAAMAAVLLAAHVHGVLIDAGTIALLVLASVALSLGVVGVPGQASYFVVRIPMFTMAGVPLDLLAPMLAIDMIPDAFRTVGNVTADVTVATLAGASASAVELAAGEAAAVAVPDIAYAAGPSGETAGR